MNGEVTTALIDRCLRRYIPREMVAFWATRGVLPGSEAMLQECRRQRANPDAVTILRGYRRVRNRVVDYERSRTAWEPLPLSHPASIARSVYESVAFYDLCLPKIIYGIMFPEEV